MTIFLMHPADARAWPAMPQLVNRMCQFSVDEHGTLEPDLIRDYLAQFITELVHPEQVDARVWVKVEDDGRVTGHIKVTMGNQHGLPFGSVAQFASDPGFPWPREEGKQLWQEIQDWVRSKGGRQVRVRARTPVHARAYRMLYGLEPTTEILMKKGV
jgi:hypothetical protein